MQTSAGSRLLIYPQTNKVENILNRISEDYVDSIDKQDLTEKIIPDILKHLDPHTVYISAKDLQMANEELEGNFGGIGVQFDMQTDTVMVVQVISGGPSEKVGILPGDRIVSVNDSTIAGVKMNADKVKNLLRGEMGTKVRVGVVRRAVADTLEFEITRGNIPLFSVDVSYMINDSVGYVKVSKFARNTYQEFLAAIAKLKAHNCKDMIIDMRENSGGYLDIAISMCNEFLSKGDMIVYTEGKASPRQIVHATGTGSCQNVGVTVLIDEFSASASEIFAGAIQDNDRGAVIGRRSFGKGLVQQPFPLTDGSEIRLTIARYYTPSGRCIQKPYENGVEDYHQDILTRLEHGEFYERDSIVLDESLKNFTRNGRIVYGGGGIMPDIFVPGDTTGINSFYRSVYGYMYQFAVKYSDENRAELHRFETAKEMSAHLESVSIMNSFIRFIEKEGVKINNKKLNQSRTLINTLLKAYIARGTLEEEGFYPIVYEIDNIAQAAVEAIRTGEVKAVLAANEEETTVGE
jgi:carboxyl-terminal processing protease